MSAARTRKHRFGWREFAAVMDADLAAMSPEEREEFSAFKERFKAFKEKTEEAAKARADRERWKNNPYRRVSFSMVKLAFMDMANFDELHRFYLSIAKRLHPDREGDTAKMQQLNAAWEILERQSNRTEATK